MTTAMTGMRPSSRNLDVAGSGVDIIAWPSTCGMWTAMGSVMVPPPRFICNTSPGTGESPPMTTAMMGCSQNPGATRT